MAEQGLIFDEAFQIFSRWRLQYVELLLPVTIFSPRLRGLPGGQANIEPLSVVIIDKQSLERGGPRFGANSPVVCLAHRKPFSCVLVKSSPPWALGLQNYGISECGRDKLIQIHIVYKEEKGWFVGHVQEYPDYESQGKTLEELRDNPIEIYDDIRKGLAPDSGVRPCAPTAASAPSVE